MDEEGRLDRQHCSVSLFRKLYSRRSSTDDLALSSGAICVAQDVADAVSSGHIRGYGGDVWEQQPGKPVPIPERYTIAYD